MSDMSLKGRRINSPKISQLDCKQTKERKKESKKKGKEKKLLESVCFHEITFH
jgi:hypothetical protein